MNTRLLAVLVACALSTGATCGGEPATEKASAAAQTTVAQSNGCPLSPDAVSQTLGKPVHLTPTPVRLMDACSYTLDSDSTVEVELSIKPANLAETLFAALHERARNRLGPDAPVDALTLGDEGWAYASRSGSEAAARKGEKVYHASVANDMAAPMPNLKNEMVRLVSAMITDQE